MSHPSKISVILTSYNHEKYLHEAVESVLNQTFADFDFIIWDDGSSDGSWDIIKKYSDPRIRSFINATEQRGSPIRSALSKIAARDYIAIQHSDDIWEPEKLEKQVSFLDAHPEIGAVFSWAHIIDENGYPFQDPSHFYYKIFEQPNRSRFEWLNFFFYHGNALCHPSVLIRKQCYDDCGLYRYGLPQTGDFDMWVRLCMKYDIHVLPERLVRFRIRENEKNVSGNRLDARIRWQFEYLKILENYRGISTLEELKKVFPSAAKYEGTGDNDLKFILGMVALETKPNNLAELFGLNLLFEFFNDPALARESKESHDIRHTDFFLLTAGRDVFSVGKIEDLTAQINQNEKTIQAIAQELLEIKSGMTWDIYQFIIQMRVKLFPSGSRQERFVHLLISAKQTLHVDGLWKLLQKSYSKLKKNVGRVKTSFVFTISSINPFQGLKNEDSQKGQFVSMKANDVDPKDVAAKVIAFYLPQFHPIPENDIWWGKGFTEWTNVSKAVPNFVGHYQPHIPGELGHYDLRLPEVQEQQVALAKKYGIFGFCFYYYWFHGKRLLERPIDQYLANPHLDLPFCLCWANENWTRRWDGAEHDILIAQEYNEEQYKHFIRDISIHFPDPRYIRVDGKPMLLVYRVNLLPDAQKASEIWRTECRRLGIGEIYLMAVQSFGITDPRPFGFDAAVEFPPSHLGEAEISRKAVKITNPNFKGKIFDYNLAVRSMLAKKQGDYTYFKSVMPSWDNTARKQNDAHIFVNSSPAAYQEWLEKVVKHSQKSLPADRRYVFVNAWNEWAEGTHLEPDRRYGYAYLQATSDAITKKTREGDWSILFVSHDANKGGAQEVLLNVVSWFKAHTNINVKVLCLQGGAWLHRFNNIVDTLVLDGTGQTDDDALLNQIEQFCGGKPDLIYGNTVAAGSLYSRLRKLNVPIITHFHELETSIRKYGAPWIKDVISLSSHFIACSEPVRKNLIQNHGVGAKEVSTIHASIVSRQSTILDKKSKLQKRKKLGLKQDATLIFGCGIGMPFRKGADIFIEIGEKLLQKGRKNFHLYWVGEFDPSYHDEELGLWESHYKKLKNQDLGRHVTFLGLKDNPREYLACGDIFLLPSREDPFPLVALEAADCGLPILCFDESGGMPDFVGDDAGFIVPRKDLNAMIEKIVELDESEELRVALGGHAKEKLLSHFTVERTTPHILSACRKTAGKRPAVSVIVPNYNHEYYLRERLNSIFGQSFKDFEVILLDDASTDHSLDVLIDHAHHADVRIVRNEINSGSPFRQWLKGIDMADSDILWIAESDDTCDPELLRTLLPVFDNPKVKLAYVNSNIIDENGRITGDYTSTEYLSSLSTTKWGRNYQVTAEQEINDGLGVKNTILNISAVLVRRFEMNKEFRDILQSMRIAGDWYFIANALKEGFVVYDAKKLNSHRRHASSVIAQTVTDKKLQDFFQEFFIVQDYIVKTYPLRHEFLNKWEAYLRKQWGDFYKDQSMDGLSSYYPLEKMRTLIRSNIESQILNKPR